MDYIIYIAIGVICFIWGWCARENVAKKRVDALIASGEITIPDQKIESKEEDFTKIIISEIGGVFYVHNFTTNAFMAQGMSRELVEESLAKRYPGVQFGATPENLKETGFIQ